jgi:hypothetical protein
VVDGFIAAEDNENASLMLNDGDDLDEEVGGDDDNVSDSVGGISDEQLAQLKATALQKLRFVASNFEKLKEARAMDGYRQPISRRSERLPQNCKPFALPPRQQKNCATPCASE